VLAIRIEYYTAAMPRMAFCLSVATVPGLLAAGDGAQLQLEHTSFRINDVAPRRVHVPHAFASLTTLPPMIAHAPGNELFSLARCVPAGRSTLHASTPSPAWGALPTDPALLHCTWTARRATGLPRPEQGAAAAAAGGHVSESGSDMDSEVAQQLSRCGGREGCLATGALAQRGS
jgi:hypothetical protein